MNLAIARSDAENAAKIEVSDVAFGRDFNEALVHQVVTASMARRVRKVAQKTRAEVRGGGRKPWRQKGTGNARAGTIRSPLWRSGGKIFAAQPRLIDPKINKKMYRGAMQSILSELLRQNRIHAVENIQMERPKTKDLLAELSRLKVQGSVLIVVHEEIDENLYLSSRNVPHVMVTDVQGITPVALIKYDNVIATVEAIRQIEEIFG